MGISDYESSADVLNFIIGYYTVKGKDKTIDDVAKTDAPRRGSTAQYGAYAGQLGYEEIRELRRQDFTGMADKSISVFPKSQMGGVLGFTYIGQGIMTLREDHAGFMRLDPLTQVHEAIHTPDEYETRVLSEWMLRREPVKYKR
ncbi:hypothetical protein HY638_05690 [Candidatus Woesearchaeota archaeon]|nr:hypothetical protein [Candidatus Woesearchaeota archaeon]